MSDEKEQNIETEELQEKLQKIKEQEGIIGYILRDEKSAAIDLSDPTKIIDYAILSSSIIDLTDTMTDSLQMDKTDTIVVESEETKLLSMKINNNRISIFMEKDLDHNQIQKRLQ
jgi:predicted regulator of Ras-like GTPase activity (Roadblock/LC7/MglB family)